MSYKPIFHKRHINQSYTIDISFALQNSHPSRGGIGIQENSICQHNYTGKTNILPNLTPTKTSNKCNPSQSLSTMYKTAVPKQQLVFRGDSIRSCAQARNGTDHMQPLRGISDKCADIGRVRCYSWDFTAAMDMTRAIILSNTAQSSRRNSPSKFCRHQENTQRKGIPETSNSTIALINATPTAKNT